VGGVVGLQRFTVKPDLEIDSGVGVWQNFGVGKRVNVGDYFPRPRFDESTGAGFAGGVFVFDCDGERLALIVGAGAALRAATVRQRVAGEPER
jgi:hypothetical protein